MEYLQTEYTAAEKEDEITDEECRRMMIRDIQKLTGNKLWQLYWYLDRMLNR